MDQTPQETVVWYVLPAIRMQLAKAMLSKGKKQTEIASILGVTKSAITQYMKSKRANSFSFPASLLKKIDESASKIIKDTKSCTTEIQLILNEIKDSGFLCNIHKKFSGDCSKCKSI